MPGRYFELSRVDAERSITLYKTFTKQTDAVVGFLSVARSYENVTRLEIPKIKHAPTSLTKSLEEYLNDKDFEINRRQYLAAQQGRKGTKFESKPFSTSNSGVRDTPAASSTNRPEPEQQIQSPASTSAPAKGPAPDLIDFFDSIEQQQQPMAQSVPESFQQQQPMATGVAPAQTGYPQMGNGFEQSATGSNPFGQYMTPAAPMNAQYTGVGFGGHGPQPPQQFVQPTGQYEGLQQQQTGFQQPGMQQMNPQQTAQPIGQPRQLVSQSTNPFRQSVVYPQNTLPAGAQQSTNPFNRMSQVPMNGIPEQQMPQQQISQQETGAQGGFNQQSLNQFASPQPIQIQRTGTNPFSRQQPQQQQAQATGQAPMPQGLTPMVTGSTNPFRQSMFVNQQTGRGWQTGGQGTMGGLEQMETVPVFPRPGQG